MKTADAILRYIPSDSFFCLLVRKTGSKISNGLLCFYFLFLFFNLPVAVGNDPIDDANDSREHCADEPPLLPYRRDNSYIYFPRNIYPVDAICACAQFESIFARW